jgi:hypothetical protein
MGDQSYNAAIEKNNSIEAPNLPNTATTVVTGTFVGYLVVIENATAKSEKFFPNELPSPQIDTTLSYGERLNVRQLLFSFSADLLHDDVFLCNARGDENSRLSLAFSLDSGLCTTGDHFANLKRLMKGDSESEGQSPLHFYFGIRRKRLFSPDAKINIDFLRDPCTLAFALKNTLDSPPHELIGKICLIWYEFDGKDFPCVVKAHRGGDSFIIEWLGNNQRERMDLKECDRTEDSANTDRWRLAPASDQVEIACFLFICLFICLFIRLFVCLYVSLFVFVLFELKLNSRTFSNRLPMKQLAPYALKSCARITIAV